MTISPMRALDRRASSIALRSGLVFVLAAALLTGVAPTLPADDTAPRRADPSRIAAPPPDPSEEHPGGDATSMASVNANAFSNPSANMGFAKELDFKIGNGVFRKLWVSSPASTKSSDGLGPLYNARACQSCHLKDGRGHPPRGTAPEERSVSMLMRLSIPPESGADRAAIAEWRQNVIAEPTYGTQLQELAIQGHAGEGRLQVTYTAVPVELAGGEQVVLRQPNYAITDLKYGSLHPAAMLSPRVTPQVIGMGLLEAIPEADILARADPEDRDGDGISGVANKVWSNETGRPALGRFGWKAGQPTVLQQVAEAFAADIGIGSWLTPGVAGDCTPRQTECIAAPHGADVRAEGHEISKPLLDLVAFYSRNLAVPRRRDMNAPDVLAGRALFHIAGCAACHTPGHVTGDASSDAHLRHQTIWPYTDLLLHDMGDGLADNRPEGIAGGREWRTAPLWGIGLTEVVNGHTFYLHDGRARSLAEAILWHDGEARASRDAFRAMAAEDRARLIAFVKSL